MVSREKKGASLHEKLQLLRALTNSHALNKMSIITDASTYIKELKQKVARLNREIACAQHAVSEEPSPPLVTVEGLDQRGFLVNVFLDKSSPGLLVSILEAFDELGLSVMEARASCAGSFRLEAVGGENEEAETTIDRHVVEEAVMQAIRSCSASGSSEED